MQDNNKEDIKEEVIEDKPKRRGRPKKTEEATSVDKSISEVEAKKEIADSAKYELDESKNSKNLDTKSSTEFININCKELYASKDMKHVVALVSGVGRILEEFNSGYKIEIVIGGFGKTTGYIKK